MCYCKRYRHNFFRAVDAKRKRSITQTTYLLNTHLSQATHLIPRLSCIGMRRATCLVPRLSCIGMRLATFWHYCNHTDVVKVSCDEQLFCDSPDSNILGMEHRNISALDETLSQVTNNLRGDTNNISAQRGDSIQPSCDNK